MKWLTLCFVVLVALVVRPTYGQVAHDYCDVMNKAVMFYKYNRAGRLPDNDVPWRGNSALGDKTPGSQPDEYGDGDLSKGYFDAGDHVKFAFPMSASMTVLGWVYLEYKDAITKCGAGKVWLEDLRWGYDWLMAAHYAENRFAAQVGNGYADHYWWGPPEMMTMERPTYIISDSAPGTELAMEVAAALATCSMIFHESDPTYAAQCLKHSEEMWKFGDTYRGVYSDSVPDAKEYYGSNSGYNDELVWGSIWLYRATGNKEYLERAINDYDNLNMRGYAQGNPLSWDQKAPGVIVLMAKLLPDSDKYAQDVKNYLSYFLPGGGVTYTPGGLAWMSEWGSARYASATAFLMSVYGTTGDKYTDFSKKQLNYILGDNPNRQSFVVGYGPNHPINPSHRAAHHSLTFNIDDPVNNTYLLLGALVGGPDANDVYKDDRHDYVKNEVACDYQAAFLGATAYMASITT